MKSCKRIELKQMPTTKHSQNGLSLVEVFVALLVLSVGLIALAKLQVDLVRGGADSRARTIAVSLAEEKLEDLRTFAALTSDLAWTTTVSPLAWSHIQNNKGGRLPPVTTYQPVVPGSSA
jgi:type IV pilus modification protein PilV